MIQYRLAARQILLLSLIHIFKSAVKVCGSTVKLQLILVVLSAVEVGGIRGLFPSDTPDIGNSPGCRFLLYP